MAIVRIKDLDKTQAQIVKKIFDQVKGRYANGEWHDFNGKIAVKSRHGDMVFEIACEFKLDGMFFTLGKSKCVEQNSRMHLPDLNNRRVIN